MFEIAVFTALAIWLIVDAGDNNDLGVFGTTFATVPGFDVFSGVIAGSVYTILAFIGFEAAAPLAEEAKDPHQSPQAGSVPRAAPRARARAGRGGQRGCRRLAIMFPLVASASELDAARDTSR